MAAAYVRAVDTIDTNSQALGIQTLWSAVTPGGTLLIIETTEKMSLDAVRRLRPACGTSSPRTPRLAGRFSTAGTEPTPLTINGGCTQTA